MSNQYPQPGWNMSGPPAGPGQQHQQMPYPPGPGGQDQWPQPKKKRTGLIVSLVLVVVLLAGGGVGVWLWQGGGPAGDPSADLPASEGLKEMAFPDPNSFGYGEGSEAMCAALSEKLAPRGYQPVSGDKSGSTGLTCRFLTPGLSLLKEGSVDIRADIGVWKDDAAQRYASLQENAVGQSEKEKNKPDIAVSKVERFPVGDAGYIYHRESIRADTEAYFRSGEYLMLVSVWGTEVVSADADVPKTKALTGEVTYQEITDILTVLNGEGEPGPPLISAPEQEKSPALEAMADLRFPEEFTVAAACPAVVAATAPAGLRPGGGGACGVERGSDDWRDHGEGYVEMTMAINGKDYPKTGNILATEELARDVRARLKMTDRECTPLYSLPFAETGYALYCGNILWVGFVLDGETYVDIEYSGHRVRDSDLEPVPVDEVMALLVTVLTAMATG